MTSQRKRLAALATIFACCIGTAQAQDCSTEASLRSSSQGAAVELSFRNASNEGRRLYWLDQNGNRKFVSVVRSGTIYSQPTAATHSWVVTDDAEKCLYAVTATTEPQTIDVSGQTQDASRSVGSPQTIVAQPAPGADPAPPPSAVPAPEAEQSVADTASTAVSDAGGEDVDVQVPQVSPIEQFSLNGNFRVLAVAEEGKSLNNQASGAVEVVRVNPEWDSGQWSFEPVAGSPFVRIKNNWKRTYLADVNGQLRAVSAPSEADQSHWSFEPVDGTAYVQLRNRETDRFLLNVSGVPNLVNDFRQDQERQSYWQVNPATDAVAVTAPRMEALSAYNSAISDCRDIGGVWTGSSCRSNYAVMGYGVAQPLACPRGWFWDQQAGECLYEVASGGPACPPWQMGPGGQCVSNLTCRGGTLRNSRRGASCDCPFGMAPWGNYPNLSCKPSVARIVPLLLLSKLGGSLNTKHGDKRFALGQVYGNKQFGKNPQNNANNGNGLIIKVSKPVITPTNLGNTTKPVISNPVVTRPVVINPNVPKPTSNNAGQTNPVGVLQNPTNPVIGNAKPTTAPPNRVTPTGTNADPSKPVNTQTGQIDANAKLKADADAKARSDAAAKLKADADAKVRNDVAAKLKADADAKAKNDVAAKLKADADAKVRNDAAAKQKADADAKTRNDAAAKQKADADAKAKVEAANKAKIDAANQAKINAANQAKINAANQAKARADAARQAEQARNAAALRQQAQAKARQVNSPRPQVRPSRCPPGKQPRPNGACA